MSYMFYGCSSLTSLDLSHFDTSKVRHMNRMFEGCSSLSTVYVGDGWSTQSVSGYHGSDDMFRLCTSLVGGAGTAYDPSHVDASYAHVDGGTSNPGYLTLEGTGGETSEEKQAKDSEGQDGSGSGTGADAGTSSNARGASLPKTGDDASATLLAALLLASASLFGAGMAIRRRPAA